MSTPEPIATQCMLAATASDWQHDGDAAHACFPPHLASRSYKRFVGRVIEAILGARASPSITSWRQKGRRGDRVYGRF